MTSASVATRIERIASSWLTLPLLSVAALVLILWLGRDATFTADELIWVIDNQDLSLRDALEPSNGHLVAVTRLVYAGLVEIQGTDYLAFRLLAAFSVLLITWVVYLYARPRVGPALALAPCLPLLVFGSSAGHVLVGNGFTILFALSCGLGAFALAIDGRRGAAIASCALLCIGIATYSVALAFVVGVAVYLVVRRDWRRLWVPGVPAVLYLIWWLWATSSVSSSDSAVAVENLLALPAWMFQLLGYALAAISGLGYDFGGGQILPALATTLAVAAVLGGVWWLHSHSVAPTALAAFATFVALSALAVLVASFIRAPDDSRYLYPAAVAVLAIVVETIRGRRPSPAVLVGVYSIVVVGAAANLLQLSNEGRVQRDTTTPGLRAALGGLELSQPSTDPAFDPQTSAGADAFSAIALAWDLSRSPTANYLEVTRQHGGVGYTEDELRDQPENVRAEADRYLIAALDIGLEPVTAVAPPCRPAPPARQVYEADPGEELVLRSATDTPISMRRLADAATTEIGSLAADVPAVLRLPEDEATGAWVIYAGGVGFEACIVP